MFCSWIARPVRCLLVTCLLGCIAPSIAAPPLTIGSNNTPLDRRALEVLSKEAFRRVDVEFKLVNLPSERALHAANQGEIDGEGLRVAGLERQYPQLVRVEERYIGISFVAFAKDRSIRLDAGWESLKPHSVAFITGWKMFEANASSARVALRVDQPEQLFRLLDSGRVDLALYTLADGLALVRQLGFTAVRPLTPTLEDVDMFLYLNAKHAALAPRLAAALRQMKADGTYARLLASIAD